MNKILFLLLTGLVVAILTNGLFLSRSTRFEKRVFKPNPAEVNEVSTRQEAAVLRTTTDFEGRRYTVLVRQLTAGESVSLIPNFREPRESQEIFSSEKCDFAINGGFYSEEFKPLGLFLVDGERIGATVKSRLLNGFVWQESGGNVQIGASPPPENRRLDFILQSGPRLLPHDEPATVGGDSHDRRAMIVKGAREKIYFSAIYDSENIFSGPKLSDLRKLLVQTSVNLHLNWEEAVNLDGGSTLTFLQKGETSLAGIKKAGSLFCVKKP